MMCQRIGWGPISTIGLGRYSVSSRSRVPLPPQRMTTGMSVFEGLVSCLDIVTPWLILEDVAETPQLLDLLLVHGPVAAGAGQARRQAEIPVGWHRAHRMGLDEGRIERLEQDLAG